MDQFLKNRKLPTFAQDEFGNLNTALCIREVEFATNTFKNEIPKLKQFNGEFYQTFQEEITPILCSLFQKIEHAEYIRCVF